MQANHPKSLRIVTFNVLPQAFLFYDGWPEIGATAHWMDDDFDTGRVLSVKKAPMPTPLTPQAAMQSWIPLMMGALTEGVARALAGDPGTVQDESGASYAAPFTAEEHWLSWEEPAATLQRKTMALNLFAPGNARCRVEEQPYLVNSLTETDKTESPTKPGTLLERSNDTYLIQSGSSVVEAVLQISTD